MAPCTSRDLSEAFSILHIAFLLYYLGTGCEFFPAIVFIQFLLWNVTYRCSDFKCCSQLFCFWGIGAVLLTLQAVCLGWFSYLLHQSYIPCDRSSCSSTSTPLDNPLIPYHPDGQYTKWPLYCPYPTQCRWGDFLPYSEPIGYPAMVDNDLVPDTSQPSCNSQTASPTTAPPCPYLATTRKQDYPDPSHGLTNGWFVGATTSYVAPCPNLDWTALQPDGITHGVGQDVCGFCSDYLHRTRGMALPKTGCVAPAGWDGFCYTCVDLSLVQTSTTRGLNIGILGLLFGISIAFYAAEIVEDYNEMSATKRRD